MIDYQEEILFDANDQSYATPMLQSFVKDSVKSQDNTVTTKSVYTYQKSKFINFQSAININVADSSVATISKLNSKVNLRNNCYNKKLKGSKKKACKTSHDTYLNKS
jgi:hypothetical protein